MAHGLRVGSIRQREPGLALERSALWRQGPVEAVPVAAEIIIEPALRLPQRRMIALTPALARQEPGILRELERRQSAVAGGHGERPGRAGIGRK